MVRDELGHVVTGLASVRGGRRHVGPNLRQGDASACLLSWRGDPRRARGPAARGAARARGTRRPRRPAAAVHPAGAGLGPGRRRRAGREVHRAARAADLRRADGGRGRGGHHARRAMDLRGARHRGGGLPPGRRASSPWPRRSSDGSSTISSGPWRSGPRSGGPARSSTATRRPGCSRTTTTSTTAGSSPSQGCGPSPTRPPRCTDGWPRRGSSTSHRSAAGTSRCGPAHGPTRS